MLSGSKKFVLIALFAVLLIILVNLAWWFHYRETERLLDGQLGRRLAALAQAASMMLEPEQVEDLLAGEVDPYLDAIEMLERVRSSDSLSEVFIIDENYRYLATTTLEPDSSYFLAALNGPFVDSVLFGQIDQSVATTTYQTGKMYLKSAFAPLYGPDGFVLAVLGVEANVDYFNALAELRRNLYYATVLSLVGGLVLGLVFLLLQRRINLAEQQLFLGQTHAHLGRMVAIVAHELKNPLMIIRASAERLVRKTDMTEAEYVVEEVDRLNGIVSGYLDFARSGGSLLAEDKLSPIDLGEFYNSIKKHITDKYADQEITWLPTIAPPSITIDTYPRSLRQVVLNLLLNGVESCQSANRPVEIGIEVACSDSEVIFKLVDHGPGVSRKELRKVLTPFYTTKTSGSGLGLYLSQKIVMEMGGRIKIESELGVGTTVSIILPCKPKK